MSYNAGTSMGVMYDEKVLGFYLSLMETTCEFYNSFLFGVLHLVFLLKHVVKRNRDEFVPCLA